MNTQYRASLLKELTEIVKDVFPSATVHVFGSQYTGIVTPSSDLDLAVLDVPSTGKPLSMLSIPGIVVTHHRVWATSMNEINQLFLKLTLYMLWRRLLKAKVLLAILKSLPLPRFRS